MDRQKKTTCVRLVFMAVLLVLSGAILFWQTSEPNRPAEKEVPGVQQSAANVQYSKKELMDEAERTYTVLQQYGIRSHGYGALQQYNVARVSVDPRDKERLTVTQEGVPKKYYYRLVRENDPVPVYIEFEFMPTALTDTL